MHAAFAKMEAANMALNKFREENAKLVDHYDALRSNYNDAVSEAKALYARYADVLGDRYHGFSRTQQRDIDVDLLLELMPDAVAFTQYKMTLKQFDKLVAEGLIDDEIQEQVISTKDKINGPPLQ